jgi:hypothetical protein
VIFATNTSSLSITQLARAGHVRRDDGARTRARPRSGQDPARRQGLPGLHREPRHHAHDQRGRLRPRTGGRGAQGDR